MTDLEEALDILLRQVPGASFAALAGTDGLVVEQVPGDLDALPEAVAEWTAILSIARRTMEDLLAAGDVQQVILRAASLTVAIWTVNREFYCLVASRDDLDPEATAPAAHAAVERIREALT